MWEQECKIVFFDIDGTLLNTRRELPPSTIQAVRGLQDRGVETVIATGRTPANFAHIREQLGIESYISLNGSYVVREGEVLANQMLQLEYIERLNTLSTEYGHALGWIGTEELGLYADHPQVSAILEMYGMKMPVNPQFYKQCEVYQGMLFCPEEEISPYVQGVPDLQFVRFDEYAVDVVRNNLNKAVGIEHYLKATGIAPDSCIAFGDGLNDIEMLQGVGLGIAMGQAKEIVKHAAKRVTRSVDEDGIALALHELGLISA